MRFLHRLRRRGRAGSARDDHPVDPRTPWPRQAVPADPAAAAAAFWRRWTELLPRISAALGDREPQRVEHELCRAVALVHPGLHFSLERGQRAIYALVVTGQEDPALRPYTDAWKAAAPPEDAIWEYHDSVPPVPDPTGVTVNLGDIRVALADVRVVAQVDPVEAVVDVAVHHPALARLAEPARTTMTFLPLDATLGERMAAERLRRVETAEHEPAGTISLLELRELVRGLADGPAPPPGENVGGAH
ncbi:hypothetical protein SAMN05421810_10259 [Amycolatopsis arida]|uniref:Uncharacterized protein n=1 Tax=Amycolatopsis arida TaxID=587909 RepID=A0A1I5NWQ0_9PSEU|nr:hypothetical protein [Amycolatopsis arida]TDX98270.1 hypothetical protein CLV69_10159 [Amycolatopsis arida]SFP26204.1 hypothetical protein SAMN05421810_10259 [Amycolatopsis arida]